MAATILNSPRAIEMSVYVVRSGRMPIPPLLQNSSLSRSIMCL